MSEEQPWGMAHHSSNLARPFTACSKLLILYRSGIRLRASPKNSKSTQHSQDSNLRPFWSQNWVSTTKTTADATKLVIRDYYSNSAHTHTHTQRQSGLEYVLHECNVLYAYASQVPRTPGEAERVLLDLQTVHLSPVCSVGGSGQYKLSLKYTLDKFLSGLS